MRDESRTDSLSLDKLANTLPGVGRSAEQGFQTLPESGNCFNNANNEVR